MTTTDTPAIFGEFGQALAFAERTLTEILSEHLAQRDVTPQTWYALKLIGSGRPGLTRAALTSDLARSKGMNADSAGELLAGLQADGLISGEDQVSLTTAGQARYRDLREYVTAPTIRLLSQFDIRDIETTVRTVQAITKRAAEDGI
jgi:DNA-binding MarR family transcriptional regulator